jgi:endoglucanase
MPESYPNACKLGGGPTVKLLDGGIISHRKINAWLADTAAANEIPFQYEILEGGATDVATIHTSRAGVVSGGMSVPCRYIHASIETVDKSDIENSVKLLAACLTAGIDK